MHPGVLLHDFLNSSEFRESGALMQPAGVPLHWPLQLTTDIGGPSISYNEGI